MKNCENFLKREETRLLKITYLTGFKILIIVLLSFSLFSRFYNLEQKPYWGDESLTSQRISGYTDQDLQSILLRGEEITVEKLRNYQRPNSDKSFLDAMSVLAGNSEHPPLYYLMARFWMQLFSDYVTTPRGLSALISLLAFPSIYWLCLELFNSPLVGWMAIAIVAISPIHVLYAQEARQYSLWTVTILISSWVLLRAMRINTKLSWGVYAVTLALGLYTHLSSVMIAVIHGIYLITKECFRFFNKTIIAYLVASFLGFILFLPWIIVIVGNSGGKKIVSPGMSNYDIPFPSLVKTWILNLSRNFWDFNNTFLYRNGVLYFLVALLTAYSLYFLCRHTQKQVWLFICTLVGVPFFSLAMLDLILGGGRSTTLRYFIPCILGIQIAIAYLFTAKIASLSVNNWERKLWQMITVVLISSGVLSCAVISQADTWWTKQREYYHSEVAKIVNQTDHPLVIAAWFDMRTLSHSLAPDAVLQDVRLRQEVNSVGQGFSHVFVYQSKGILDYLLENNPHYRIEKVYEWKRQTTPVNTTQTTLWQLAKK